MDVRYADAAGRTFVLGGSEDAFAKTPAFDEGVDAARRLQELRLVVEAADALARARLPAEVSPEVAALVEAAGPAREAGVQRTEGVSAAEACGIAYQHKLTIRRKDAFLNGTPADHSAVRLDVYKRNSDCTSSTYGHKYSCNHGTCATSSTMSTKCTWASAYRSYTWPVFQTEMSTGTSRTGGCASSYGFIPPLHVCNGDTHLQVLNIKYGRTSTSSDPIAACIAGLILRAPACTL